MSSNTVFANFRQLSGVFFAATLLTPVLAAPVAAAPVAVALVAFAPTLVAFAPVAVAPAPVAVAAGAAVGGRKFGFGHMMPMGSSYW